MAAPAQPPAAPPIDEFMTQLQARYSTIDDFSADFEHSYVGGVLQAADVERGAVRVKKPGRWRFDYTHPEAKRFVSDGRTIHSYFPADRQVVVTELPEGETVSTPASFLAGDGDLTRDFSARYAAAGNGNGDTLVVDLTPMRPDADYEFLTLAIDPDNFDMRRLAATDFQGGISTYVFSNLEHNQDLPDALFTFDPPRGVEVIIDDSFAR